MTSKILFVQVHYGHLLVPGQVSSFVISTPLYGYVHCVVGPETS